MSSAGSLRSFQPFRCRAWHQPRRDESPVPSAACQVGLSRAHITTARALAPSRGEALGRDPARTRLSVLNNMVSRGPAEYAGHRGNCGMLGLPVRAKATHAALTLSARA
jgi:hypothetical protein